MRCSPRRTHRRPLLRPLARPNLRCRSTSQIFRSGEGGGLLLAKAQSLIDELRITLNAEHSKIIDMPALPLRSAREVN
jgi:hypothetical protein